MNSYEDILIEADSPELITREKPLQAHKGRIKENRIAVNNKMTEKEKKYILAEEPGHYYTGTGDILDQSSASNSKQKLHGRIHTYTRLIGLKGIIDAYKNHCMSLSEKQSILIFRKLS